jgi:3-dehydroquinate synthase
VLIDTATLKTLDPRQYRAGLGEVVKYGVILDADLFAYLEANVAGLVDADHDVLGHVIARCCRLKADVVEQDEREESGLRAVLNYGHTFGHAFEALLGYGELLHGEAVAIGMAAAASLASDNGVCRPETAQRQIRLLRRAGLPVCGRGESVTRLMHIMKIDKKSRGGRSNFVLTPHIGHARICNNLMPFSVRRVLDHMVSGA